MPRCARASNPWRAAAASPALSASVDFTQSASSAAGSASAGPASSSSSTSASRRIARSERLEGHDGEGVLHAGQALHPLGDEMADVQAVVEIAFQQQVVLAGDRV